jgi:hypothetical protein
MGLARSYLLPVQAEPRIRLRTVTPALGAWRQVPFDRLDRTSHFHWLCACLHCLRGSRRAQSPPHPSEPCFQPLDNAVSCPPDPCALAQTSASLLSSSATVSRFSVCKTTGDSSPNGPWEWLVPRPTSCHTGAIGERCARSEVSNLRPAL